MVGVQLLVCIVRITVLVFPKLEHYGLSQGSILGLLLFLLYINGLSQSLLETGSYLCADDIYIFYRHKGVKQTENFLNKEFS